MNALVIILLASLAAETPQPQSLTNLGTWKKAEFKHPGDRRTYVIYPGTQMLIDVVNPTSVEISARAVLGRKKRRANLRVRMYMGDQVLLDQSQALSVDRKARTPKHWLTRPLVGFADVSSAPSKLRVEVESAEAVSAIFIAISAVEFDTTDAPLPDLADAAPLPDLVALAPVEEANAATVEALPTQAESTATSSVVVEEPYDVSRYAGIEVMAVFGFGVPAAELAARYYIPILSERLSTGIKVSYTYNDLGEHALNSRPGTSVHAGAHVVPILAFAEAELIRLDSPLGRLSAGLQGDLGLVPISVSHIEYTRYYNSDQQRVQTDVLGWTWTAGGLVTMALSAPFGSLVADVGYMYAPTATIRSELSPTRSVTLGVMGPRCGLGYRLIF